MAKIRYRPETISEHAKQIDIQGICVKHNIGRHDLIGVATQVARLGSITPVQALERLLECDDIPNLLTNLKFNSLDKDL
jgi:predicted nucleotidyltransferase